jgi:ankyrin repeat protein
MESSFGDPPVPLDPALGFVLEWSENWNALFNTQVTGLSKMGLTLDHYDAYDATGACINPVNPLLNPSSMPSFPLRFVFKGIGVAAGEPLHDEVVEFVAPAAASQPARRQASASLVLIPLCRKGDRAAIERLLQAGANVNELDIEYNTPLHVAVEAPRNEVATLQCLLEYGADPNAVNYIGATPLHYVCLRKSNHRGIANILLENGALINSTTLAGKSALHFACESSLPELVEVLCTFGADPNCRDQEGHTASHSVVSKQGGRDTVKRQILEHLIQYGVHFNLCDEQGMTPLHLTCQNGFLRCAQLLAPQRNQVNWPEAVNLRQETCLHLSCLHGHTEISQWLLEVAPGLVDIQDCEGNTPLHVCAKVGNLDSAVLLLRHGATSGVKNRQQRTALDIAVVDKNFRGTGLDSTHNPELVQALTDARQKHNCRQS